MSSGLLPPGMCRGENIPGLPSCWWGLHTLGASRLVASSLQSLPCPHVDVSVALRVLVRLLQDTLIALRAHPHPGALVLICN